MSDLDGVKTSRKMGIIDYLVILSITRLVQRTEIREKEGKPPVKPKKTPLLSRYEGQYSSFFATVRATAEMWAKTNKMIQQKVDSLHPWP